MFKNVGEKKLQLKGEKKAATEPATKMLKIFWLKKENGQKKNMNKENVTGFPHI